jgi:hypothetical protein
MDVKIHETVFNVAVIFGHVIDTSSDEIVSKTVTVIADKTGFKEK